MVSRMKPTLPIHNASKMIKTTLAKVAAVKPMIVMIFKWYETWLEMIKQTNFFKELHNISNTLDCNFGTNGENFFLKRRNFKKLLITLVLFIKQKNI